MKIDAEKIEQICEEIWELTTQLRNLTVAARESDRLSLTNKQKKLLKDELLNVKQQLEAKVQEL